MVGIKLDRSRGPVSFDDMRNPIQNIYIKKVEKKKMFGYDKDELWNTVTKTYPNVSQFWTYGKDKFLRSPSTTRTSRPASSANNGTTPGPDQAPVSSIQSRVRA